MTTKGLSLEEAVMQIADLVDERGLRITMKPTKVICFQKDLQMANELLNAQQKLEHAIAWLGDHYVFHKDNQVKKFKRPVPLCSDPRVLNGKPLFSERQT